MKKRVMKKWIPKNTDYCYKAIGVRKDGKGIKVVYCRNLIFKGIKTFTGEYNGEPYEEHIPVYKCRYTGLRNVDDFCLLDDCKCCNIGLPDIKDYI